MSFRVSTHMLHQQSLATLLAKQARMAHTQQQLATGQRLVTAKDDPVAAGAAVGLDRALAELEQFAADANTVQNRLGLQENALTAVGDAMARIGELVVRANNATLGDDDRRAIASELKAIRQGLLGLANSTDGSGRYLFAGTLDGSPPFVASGGSVAYHGDQTQRQVEIAAGSLVLDALPGSEAFMRLRTGDGRVDAHAGAGNAGTALLMDFGVTDAAAWNGASYRIEFDGAGGYQVFDAGNDAVGGGTHAAGESIAFGGLQLRLSGEPAAGDTFEIGRAGTRDVFATVQDLIGALESTPVTAAEKAAMQNALQRGLRDVTTAQNHLIDARAGGGAQLAAIDRAASLREADAVTLQGTLSTLRDLNWAEAISRYNLEHTALQAAQLTFAQMQSMSLFNLMR